MPNSRIFYAIEQLAIKNNSYPATNAVAPFDARLYPSGVMARIPIDQVLKKWEVPRGVQSVGMTTTFNTEEAFEYGQVEVYEQSERQPDIEFTISKVIDGTKPLWFMVADPSGTNNSLISKTDTFRSDVILTIFSSSNYRATGNPVSACLGSGMYLTGATYTFPVDGPCTEEVTVMGNDKIWSSFDATLLHQDEDTLTPPITGAGYWEAPEGVPSGVFGWLNNAGAQETAVSTPGAGLINVGSGIQRREKVDLRRSLLPADIPGVAAVASSGLDAAYLGGVAFNTTGGKTKVTVADCNCDDIAEHIQNITCSVDLGRTDIFELGSKRPYLKTLAFPVTVTCSIEVITSNGDMIDARSLDNADNTNPNNTIVLRTAEGMQLDLGSSNRLVSVDCGGGDAGGDNRTVTYSYQSFNYWSLTHDNYSPNHRICVFSTGNSRFNQGEVSYKRSDFGINEY